MQVKAEDLPLHLARLETAKGMWLIAVASVAEAEDRQNLFLKLVVEQNLDEESVTSRELGLFAPANIVRDPETLIDIVARIRGWIETTDGDGFLDLVTRQR